MNDTFEEMIRTDDGGYLIGGKSITDEFREDFNLVKVDSSGREEWARSYHWSETNNRLQGIAQTIDGGYLMAGWVRDSSDAWLAKVDLNGELLWTRSYASWLSDVAVDLQGRIFIIGEYRNDYWLIRVNEEGDVIWEQGYGGDGDEYPNKILPTRDGGLIIVGSSSSDGGGRALVVKVDSSGAEEWINSYSGRGSVVFTCVREMSNRHFILGGWDLVDHDDAHLDIFAMEIDSVGIDVWSRTYYHRNDDKCQDIEIAPQGGFLIIGEKSWAFEQSGYIALRVDSQGNILWNLDVGLYTRGSFDAAFVLEDGGYILGGQNEGTRNDLDYWLVRTTPDTTRATNVELSTPIHPILIGLDAPYPNPFNSSSTLSFTLPSPGRYTLGAFDIDGRDAGLIAEENFPAGRHLFRWTAPGAGVWFVRLSDGKRRVAVVRAVCVP